MNTSVDRKTLAWIKEGVDETLKSVHHAPDDFLGNMDDPSPIKACIGPLHLVCGVVKMVHIQGATMLVQELESLASALAEKRIKQKKDAAEVLATGMLQLPGYLESLYHGQPDIPLILLPLLNDLRASQDKELLTEGEFFAPDLSIQPPLQTKSECIIKGDFSVVAKKLRPGYLAGLLDFINGEHIPESLDNICLVLKNLKIASSSAKAQQLWWISLAMAESLQENSLDYSIAIKILLGRIDRQIQRAIEHGEKFISSDDSNKIIKNLLYYISQSDSYNDNVVHIRKAFGLDYPDSGEVEKARENLYGFNVNLVGTISEQINEELTAIKDMLGIAMHSKNGSTEGMDVMLARFSTISNALEMLGMHKPKQLIHEQWEFLEPRISSGDSLTVEEMMDIAAALLQVESSLTDLGRSLDSYDNDSSLPPAEYDIILKLVAKEALQDMGEIKTSIEQYSTQPDKTELLEHVPERLVNIIGALRILKFELQTNLAVALYNYINQGLISKGSTVNNESMDFLADAIIGLEIFFLSILEESVTPETGLRVASESISQLGYPPSNDMIPTLTSIVTSMDYDLPLASSSN